MAARKKAKKPLGEAKSASGDESLYLGCFFFDDFINDEEHTGTFQMVVAAASPEQAVERFRKRLRAIRRIGSVLAGPNTVYLQGFIPLTGSFKQGVLVNYESRPSPEPPDYQLLNMTPEQGVDDLGCYELDKDGDNIEPFVDFGGQAHLRALAAAKKAGNEHSLPATFAKPRLSAQERERARAEAAAQKARRSPDAGRNQLGDRHGATRGPAL